MTAFRMTMSGSSLSGYDSFPLMTASRSKLSGYDSFQLITVSGSSLSGYDSFSVNDSVRELVVRK